VSGRAVYINSDNKIGTLVSTHRFKDEIKPMDKASEASWKHRNTIFLRSARHMAIPGISTNDRERFIVRADEKLTVFLELERITHELAVSALLGHGN